MVPGPGSGLRGSTVAALALAVALAASAPALAQEELADVEFTVSVSEPSDSPPQPVEGLDLVEVALGEPGDGTLVLRATLAAAPTGPEVSSRLYFGFTTGAGDVVGGCTFAGAPATRNIGEPVAPDACIVSGAVVYAVYEYGTLEAAVGDTITQIWGFTDGCVPNAGCLPADTAPGGIANQGWPATTFGADYPLTGCTRTAGCGGSGEAPIEPLTGGNVSVQLDFGEATSAQRAYAWTTTLTSAALRVSADGNGSVSVAVRDGNGTEVANETLEAPGNATAELGPAAPGNWSIVLALEGFSGSVVLELGPATPAGDGGNGTVGNGTSTSASTSRSASTTERTTGSFPLQREEDAPAATPLALAALLALAAVAVRRRLP